MKPSPLLFRTLYHSRPVVLAAAPLPSVNSKLFHTQAWKYHYIHWGHTLIATHIMHRRMQWMAGCAIVSLGKANASVNVTGSDQ